MKPIVTNCVIPIAELYKQLGKLYPNLIQLLGKQCAQLMFAMQFRKLGRTEVVIVPHSNVCPVPRKSESPKPGPRIEVPVLHTRARRQNSLDTLRFSEERMCKPEFPSKPFSSCDNVADFLFNPTYALRYCDTQHICEHEQFSLQSPH